MKVALTVEVGEYERKTISHHYGQTGLATRIRVRTLIEGMFDALLQDLEHDYEQDLKRQRGEDE